MGISLTRSRPHKRNDQPRVEQKNGSLVRHLVGYGRYTTKAAAAQLGHIYELVRLHSNFFQPNTKLVDRVRQGSRVIKRYDTARTPYQRLLDAGVLDPQKERELRDLYDSCNPLQLYDEIEAALSELWAMETTDPLSELAARARSEGR